jgi:uncharacterized protein YcsI (UPF0317 family)
MTATITGAPSAKDDTSMLAARATRLAIRSGAMTGNTAGIAPGCIQGNIVILPAAQADAFADYCRANHQACPLLAVSRPGDPTLPGLGQDIDMRHDLPGYRVFRDGALVDEVSDIEALWRDDLVTFVIGCSFTFEAALTQAGIPLRHVLQGRNVAMYRTNRETIRSGPFGGALVVSMRPVREADAERAAAITARFPDMHGAPIHWGDPGVLGIADLMAPDYGEAVSIEPGEVPMFWACGVTSQVAVEVARLPFFIAHAPGKMLVTDQRHPSGY